MLASAPSDFPLVAEVEGLLVALASAPPETNDGGGGGNGGGDGGDPCDDGDGEALPSSLLPPSLPRPLLRDSLDAALYAAGVFEGAELAAAGSAKRLLSAAAAQGRAAAALAAAAARARAAGESSLPLPLFPNWHWSMTSSRQGASSYDRCLGCRRC